MILAIVQRLIAVAPTFKKVGGAVDFDRALSNLTIDPAAFVLPLAKSAGENAFEFNAIEQEVTAMIGVAMAVRALQDATGDAALEVLTPFEDAVTAALLGWSPDANVFSEFTYGGGQLLGFKDGVLWWQSDYLTTYHIRKTF